MKEPYSPICRSD